MSKKKFDWEDLLNLARNLSESRNEAELRTSIDRFYFSSFCYSRDYLIDNKIYLVDGGDSKSKMNSNQPIVRETTREIYSKHHKLNKKYSKKISRHLNELRKKRNKVSYDNQSIDNLNKLAKFCEIRANKIFEYVDELKKEKF